MEPLLENEAQAEKRIDAMDRQIMEDQPIVGYAPALGPPGDEIADSWQIQMARIERNRRRNQKDDCVHKWYLHTAIEDEDEEDIYGCSECLIRVVESLTKPLEAVAAVST